MTDHDGVDEGARRRLTWRVLAGGLVLAVAVTVVVGVTTGSGRLGVGALLTAGAFACALAAVVTLVVAVRDEWRGHRVPRRRMLTALGLLVAAPVLLVFAAGAIGAAAVDAGDGTIDAPAGAPAGAPADMPTVARAEMPTGAPSGMMGAHRPPDVESSWS